MAGVSRQKSLQVPILSILAASIVLAILAAVWSPGTRDLPLQLVNKDFANYWMAGRLALTGDTSVLFGPPDRYFAAMRSVFGPDYPWHNWSYPPHAVLALVPLGTMDFLPALVLFAGVTLALYLLAIDALAPRWTPMAALLVLPFVAANLVSTQNGFLTAALMIGGLATRTHRPVLAGILFGMLTFKPQLGLLLPLLLLAERRWLVVAVAAATTGVLVLTSVAAFGGESWAGYVRDVLPYQTEVMNLLGGDFAFMMGSAFGAARAYGLTGAAAMMVHLPFAALGLLLFGLALWRVRDGHARAFAMLLASLVVVPYSVAYDFGAVAAFAALWPIAARSVPPPARLRIALQGVAILPMAMMPLAKAGLPVAPVVLLLALALLLESEGVFDTAAPAAR